MMDRFGPWGSNLNSICRRSNVTQLKQSITMALKQLPFLVNPLQKSPLYCKGTTVMQMLDCQIVKLNIGKTQKIAWDHRVQIYIERTWPTLLGLHLSISYTLRHLLAHVLN